MHSLVFSQKLKRTSSQLSEATLALQNSNLSLQLRETGGLSLGFFSVGYSQGVTSRQKALTMGDLTSVVPFSQGSQFISACCPTSKNSCFLYFVHFSRVFFFNHRRVILDCVTPSWSYANVSLSFQKLYSKVYIPHGLYFLETYQSYQNKCYEQFYSSCCNISLLLLER